jgi:tRNA pseudouridine55 synthase
VTDTEAMPGPHGLLIVDKPSGVTSHDVVRRVRKAASTRRVGHAGTLDPMATGVLILGLGRATRLLGHLALHDKDYAATIRLGSTTLTDDAEGQVLVERDATDVSDEAIRTAVAELTGDLLQVPSRISAIKVDGKRSYARVRAGEEVELAARPVTVSAFTVDAIVRSAPDLPAGAVDLQVRVTCSTGTYVRALARDLGELLRTEGGDGEGAGVGAHLTSLRRTRVGAFDLTDAVPMSRESVDLDVEAGLINLDAAVERGFPLVEVNQEQSVLVLHGRPLEPVDVGLDVARIGDDPRLAAAIGVMHEGRALALMEIRKQRLKPLVVFA